MEALKRANDIRTARATVKKGLRAGRISILDLLRDPPEFLLTAKVFDLLLAAPGFGRVRVNSILNQTRISPSKTLGGLSERQRRMLLSQLEKGGEKQRRLKPSSRTVNTQTKTRTEARRSRGRKVDSAKFLLDEWKRLVGEQDLDRDTLERAARLAAAEETWRKGLGALFSEREVIQLLEADESKLELMKWNGELIALPSSSGEDQYPAFQFQDGRVSEPLAHAHSMLVSEGGVSPWTAASWIRSSHPELEGLSPAQWAGTGKSEGTLLRVAERDASRLSQ